MKIKFTFYLIMISQMITTSLLAAPLGTEFTYQGYLIQLSNPATGPYDFQFELYDIDAGGIVIAAPIQLDNVSVDDGVFTVELDFGLAPYNGDKLWLEISVREGASVGGYTGLLPRQKIAAVPYALHAEFVAMDSISSVEILNNSITADDLASNSVDSAEIALAAVDNDHLSGGIQANKIVGTAAVTDFTGSQSFDNGLLYLDASNNRIGINTIAPSSSLDVIGNIQSTGNITTNTDFSYSPPKTYSHAIPPMAFSAAFTSNPTDYHNYDISGGYGFVRKTGNVYVIAPVNLPHESTVTAVQCYWYDTDASNDYTTFSLTLYSATFGSSSAATMASVSALSTSMTGHDSNVVENIVDTTISLALIDTDNRYYYMLLRMNSNDAATPCINSCQIRNYGCKIDYTLNRVSSP